MNVGKIAIVLNIKIRTITVDVMVLILPGEQDSLPLLPFEIKEALHGKLSRVCPGHGRGLEVICYYLVTPEPPL